MEQELLHMFQSITTSDHDELVDQFAFLLQTDVSTANFFLESSNWNVETAANMYLSTVYTSDGARNESLETEPPENSDCTPMDIVDTNTLQGMMITDLSESSRKVFAPGSIVTMNWTFVNSGEVDWPLDTELVCIQGQHICNQEAIPVVARAKETVHVPISLSTPRGEDTITCDPASTTVSQLQYLITQKYRIPTNEYFLQFATKILSSKDRFLSYYRIQHGDRIHIQLRLCGGIDYQNRVGSKPGSGGVASESQANIDRRERLRKLALETIDLSKDPYFMKNHLGSYECKLCLTLHNNEGNYLAHTQGKRHQTNLARRAAKEASEAANSIAQANFLEATAAAAAAAARPRPLRIGLPGYKVMKQRDPDTNARMLTFQILYPEYDRKLQPRHRFMSAYEQKIEPADKNYQYLLFACEPYETIGFKIPNLELDRRKEKFFSNWDKEGKTFTLQLSFAAESDDQNELQPPAPPPPRPQLRFL